MAEVTRVVKMEILDEPSTLWDALYLRSDWNRAEFAREINPSPKGADTKAEKTNREPITIDLQVTNEPR